MSLHLGAKEGEVASKVLLPGDPLRAEYIAKTYLENPICYNKIRGMYGFTGTYKGEKISVQGTGMGMPSFSIYANELIQSYGVKKLIRVGTCGSINMDVKIKDLVLAMSSHTDSGMNKDRFGSIDFAATASFSLLHKAYALIKEKKYPCHVGSVFCSDKFYDDRADEKNELMRTYHALAVEMESAELYTLAARYGVEGLAIMTVSDHILTGEQVPAQERQTKFDQMMEIALETLVD